MSVFYKAAFYDRQAHARLLPRFEVVDLLPISGKVPEGKVAYAVADAGEVVMRWEPVDDGLASGDWAASDAAKTAATAWLDERYPQHRDSTAHWI